MNEKDMMSKDEDNSEIAEAVSEANENALESNAEQHQGKVNNEIIAEDERDCGNDEPDQYTDTASDTVLGEYSETDTVTGSPADEVYVDGNDDGDGTDAAVDMDENNVAEIQKEEEEDIAYVAERITGVRHSEVTTAAPIRTRTPEQNRSVTNGIPVRERKFEVGEPTAEPARTSKSKLLSPLVITASAAVLAVILMISAVLAINSVYVDSTDSGRAYDFNMSDKIDPDSLIQIESKLPDHTIADNGSETTGETDTSGESNAPSVEPDHKKYSVTLDFFDGDDITVATERITFGKLLEQIDYTLKNTDRPSVENDFVIASDTVIKIDEVKYINVTVTEDIEYEVERIETDLIMRGTTNYLTQGEVGMKEVLYSVEYVNGVEASRTFVSEQVTKAPINEKYEYGVGGSFVGADGVTYTYSMRRVVPATYYNIEGPTYLGFDADETVIAVDPKYIPLNTVLYVKNDKFDFGKRIAADTGSLVKGWEVDIWISNSNPQLAAFKKIGYHYDMEIYYIDQ